MTLFPINEKNETQYSKRVSRSYLKINGNMLNRPNVKLMFEILAKKTIHYILRLIKTCLYLQNFTSNWKKKKLFGAQYNGWLF